MRLLQSVLSLLTPKGRKTWLAALTLGILASILEVASAATFSLLTSSFFGGRNSNLGILETIVPFSITQTVMILILSFIFIGKLIVQWLELNLKSKVAEEFFNSSFASKYNLIASQIEESEFPSMSVARQMHNLTHNVYYPMGIVISEVLMLALLVPFIFLISFKGSLLVFGITLLLSIPSLRIVRKKIQVLIELRNRIDYEVDKISYTKYRVYLDLGESFQSTTKLQELMHLASQLDRKVVKLGSYSRLTIEFCFIVAIISAFIFIDELVPPYARIQFFAVLAYSFFRIIPSFSRIMSARNQLSSFSAEFQEIYNTKLLFSIREGENVVHTEFSSAIEFDYSDHHFSPKRISLEMGDFVLIQGITGVGKTTLLKSIAGVKSGNFFIKIDGDRVVPSDRWKPKVAIVSQQPFLVGNSLIEMVTGHDVLEAVNLSKYNLALDLSCLSETIEKTRFSLTNEAISGGERKQIALARAIYSDPTLLILDELTAGMDQQLAINILSNLKSLPKNRITLITSHDFALEQFFTKVIRLSRD